MKSALKECLIGFGCIAATMVLLYLTLGCEPNMDRIQSEFCNYYPEVCQYVDFSDLE